MKRILSLLLCLSMLLSSLPANVLAAEAGESPAPVQTAPPVETGETVAPTETGETETATETGETETSTETADAAEETQAVPTEAETTAPPETVVPEDLVPATEEASASETQEEVYIPQEPVFVTDLDLPDSEELFAEYAAQQFYGGISAYGIAAGSRLTGDEAKLYEVLVPEIRKMAAGQTDRTFLRIGRGNSAQPVDITLDEPFTGTGFEKDRIYRLSRALLADLPYELYWMDKTVGIQVQPWTSSTGVLGQIYIYFPVSEDYRNYEVETPDAYDLDTEKTRVAADSAANARNIVAAYQEELDYYKLLGYKNEICSLVTYNKGAATDKTTPYGDPWQLIYVFDGNPDTNVVCEGYAKAFQYLCDLSDFEKDILCHSVTGYTNNDPISNKHMWNILSVEGKNYLVDVTNSDSGMIGSGGHLFLAGTTGSISSGYQFSRIKYNYNETATSTWGTGADSVLNLDSVSLTADTFPTFPMSLFRKMLEGTDPAVLSTELTLTENITIPRDLTIASGGSLLVPQGITLTIPSGVTVTNQGAFSIAGGNVVLKGTLSGNAPQIDESGIITGTGTYAATVSTPGELAQLLALSPRLPALRISLGASMTLAEDTSILGNTTLELNGVQLTVANNKTLTNQGSISIGDSGTLTLEKGAALEGNQPDCTGSDAVFEDLNILSQDRLERMLRSQTEVTADMSLTLTADLVIPEGKTLIITGKDVFLTVPEGLTLQNLGDIQCLAEGGIQVQGGTLENQGRIHIKNLGILSVTEDSTFTAAEGSSLSQYRITDSDGTLVSGTCQGIDPSRITVAAEGLTETQLQDLLSQLNADRPAALNFLVSRDLSLTGEITWPSYAAMTIPEGVTLTVAEGASLCSNGQILLEGSLIPAGTVDTEFHTIQVTHPLPGDLTGDAEKEAYLRQNIIITDGPLPGFVFPGTVPTALNCVLSSGSGTAEDPASAPVGTAVSVQMEQASPFGADVINVYYTFQILEGDGQLLVDLYGEGYEPYPGEVYFGTSVKVCSDTAGRVVLRVTPRDSRNQPYDTQYARDIVISFQQRHLEIEASGGHRLEDGTYQLWSGSTMTLTPTLWDENNNRTEGTIWYAIDDAQAQEYTGDLTISAPDALENAQTTTVTFRSEGVEPITATIVMLPTAASVEIFRDGTPVTGEVLTIDRNETQQTALSAAVTPEDALLGQGQIRWTSSDEAIAAVDASGNVTFLGNGTVTITAAASFGAEQTASVTFHVIRSLMPSDNNPGELIGGKRGSFLLLDPDTGKAMKTSAVKWFLCDPEGDPVSSHPYASISSSGSLTTKAVADTDQVYLMAQLAKDPDSRLSAPVKVKLYPAISSAAILDASGNPISGTVPFDLNDGIYRLGWTAGPCLDSIQSVSWKSSSTKTADFVRDENGELVLDENGSVQLSALKSGSVTVTLTLTDLSGKKTTASVKLKIAAYTKSLRIEPPADAALTNGNELTLYSGESVTFTASSTPAEVTKSGHSWVLSNKNAGSITSKGVFKAKTVLNPTEVTLSAVSKDGRCTSDPIIITVLPKEDALVLYRVAEDGETILQSLTKTTQTVSSGDEAWHLAATKDVTWTSSKPACASIREGNILEFHRNGSTVITAKTADGRYKTTFTLKVSKMSESVTVAVKNDAKPVLASGKSLNLVGTVTYDDPKSTTDTKVTWSMCDQAGNPIGSSPYATVSSSGKVTAAKNLTTGAKVYLLAAAKDGRAVSEPFEIMICPAATALEIFGTFSGRDQDVTNTTQTLDLVYGSSVSLSARVFPGNSEEDTQNAWQDVSWKSSSTKIADFEQDEAGNAVLVFKKTGTVTITATANDGTGKKASFKVTAIRTVTTLTLPETAFVGGSKSLSMTKLDDYSLSADATNKKLSWTMTMTVDGKIQSVPKTIATLSTSGVLSTRAVTGTTPVILTVQAAATDGSGKTASCTVTIYPATKGVTIYDTAGKAILRTTIPLAAGGSYTICPDTTNVSAFGAADGTADEVLPAQEAWTVTASGLTWAETEPGKILITAPDALKGKTVRFTVKANDGSGRSAYVSFRIS